MAQRRSLGSGARSWPGRWCWPGPGPRGRRAPPAGHGGAGSIPAQQVSASQAWGVCWLSRYCRNALSAGRFRGPCGTQNAKCVCPGSPPGLGWPGARWPHRSSQPLGARRGSPPAWPGPARGPPARAQTKPTHWRRTARVVVGGRDQHQDGLRPGPNPVGARGTTQARAGSATSRCSNHAGSAPGPRGIPATRRRRRGFVVADGPGPSGDVERPDRIGDSTTIREATPQARAAWSLSGPASRPRRPPPRRWTAGRA